MKKKLVLWGTNANDERVLIAMELQPEANKVNIYTFPGDEATEEFANQMMNEWRNDQEVPFPENHQVIERELTISESILPDDLKVERGDIVQRAQTEWHFIVLSAKLNDAYQAELVGLKEKIEALTSYDSKIWDALKDFWNKVQTQVNDQNLFRDHANNLRDKTNALFGKMKELRSALDDEFKKVSQTHFSDFMAALEAIEKKISDGLNLNGVFEDLKKMQKEFRDTRFTKEHRAKVWEKLDATFKLVKEKRFGSESSGDNSPMERLQRRYAGLVSAIEKMERSIHRDKDDLKFQDRKIADSGGQLEMQIRQAKLKMVEERIHSKEEKLAEMNQTKADLERRIESQKAKDAKKAERDKVEAARLAAKEKIAEEIKSAEEARAEDSEDLEKAAAAITGEEPVQEAEKEESLVDAVTSTMGEMMEDVVDTIKAVAEVVSGKVEETVADFKKEMQEESKKQSGSENSAGEEE